MKNGRNGAGHIKAVLLPESERLDGAQARRNGVQLDNAIFMCPTPFLTGSISDFSVADPRTIRECSLWHFLWRLSESNDGTRKPPSSVLSSEGTRASSVGGFEQTPVEGWRTSSFRKRSRNSIGSSLRPPTLVIMFALENRRNRLIWHRNRLLQSGESRGISDRRGPARICPSGANDDSDDNGRTKEKCQ